MGYFSFDEEIDESLLPASQLLKVRKRRKALFFSFVTCLALFFCLMGCKALFSDSSPPITRLRSANPDFLGREKILKDLEKALLAKRWSFRSKFPLSVRVLWGIGGIGKTELALKYANDHLEDYALIWNFDCANKQLFEEGYRILAERLGIYADEEILFDVIKRKVHTYLEERRFRKPWLLIFDNVEEELTRDDFPFQGGAILITARESSVRRDPNEHVQVPFFSQEEGAHLLMNVTGEEKSQEVEDLAESLLCYPLTLNQAAHYIRETPSVSIARCLKIFQEKENLLDVPVSEDNQYGYTLENVWDLTLENLQKEAPLALEWLKVCSYFAPDQIPLKWLEADPLFAGKSDAIIRRLQALALITYDVESSSFSIHRLMRKVLLERQKDNSESFLCALKCLMVNGNFDFLEYATWEGGRNWFSHALALSSHSTYSTINQPNLKASLFLSMGQWMHIEGEYTAALEYCNQALEQSSAQGQNDLIAFQVLRLKGDCLWRICKYKKAKRTLQISIEGYRRICIKPSIDLARALLSLNTVLNDLGEYEEAFNVGEEAIRIARDHDRQDLLARAIRAQAWNYFRLGKGEIAAQESKKALAILKGMEDTHLFEIGWCLMRLGGIYSYAGDLQKAENCIADSIEYIQSELTLANPLAGVIYINSGEIVRAKGEYKKAIELENLGMACCGHIGLRYHAFCLSNMGSCKQGLGQFEEGLRNHSEALAMLKKLFGEKGIDVGRAYKRMGRCLREMGRVEEGLEAQNTALRILEELFPKGHPIIAAAWKEKGACLLELGRFEEAIEACQNAFNYWNREGKKEHPQKAKSLQVLARVYQAMGQSEKAQQLFLEAFLVAHRTYNESHPDLKGYCMDLAAQFDQTEDSLWKARTKEVCYPLMKKTMGRWHPISRKMARA